VSRGPTRSEIDSAIGADTDDDGIAARLAEHEPSDRFAVVESSGAWWLVYRGTESDTADDYASEGEAMSAYRAITKHP
jgi:hypothetical protein